jgi:hypothetical protein
MRYVKRIAGRSALAVAAASSVLVMGQLPAEAAPVGAIQCGLHSYLCIQTDTVSSSNATISGWSDTRSFYGTIEMTSPPPKNELEYSYGGSNHQFNAGGKGFVFTLPCEANGGTYNAWALDRNGNVLDYVPFTIHRC